MATGSHEGYRDNGFDDKDSELSSSREFVRAKDERFGVKHANRESRVKRKDNRKAKEVANDGYQSSSSRSDSVRSLEREPGELSSESGGSDHAIDSGVVKDEEESALENGNHSPLESKSERKRKFSPVVWDREDRCSSKNSRGTMPSSSAALPPLPKLPREASSLVHHRITPTFAMKDNKLRMSQNPLAEPLAAAGSVETYVSAAPGPDPDSVIPSEKHWSGGHEDDFIPARHISSSRWADEVSSHQGEGKMSDTEELYKRRIKPLFKQTGAQMQSQSPALECGEGKIGASEGDRGDQFDSDDHRLQSSRCSSKDLSPDDDSAKKDVMDIDEEDHDRYHSLDRSDTDLDDIQNSAKVPEPAAPPQRSVNMLQGCRSVDVFERMNKIDEGTYGVVYRAKDKKTGEIVALKKVKMEKEREGFPLTSLREINVLLSIHHPSIVDVKEVVVGSNLDSIFMVMEYMEHDLKALMETLKQPFSQSEVKCLMLQLLEGVKYLHDNWVLHRDLKTSNLLLNNRGELKICDLGLARQYGSPLKPYTHLVVTLWYRAPELLLGAKQYSTAIDMWSLGCIMAELLSKEPLFPGKTELEQLDKIFKTLGTPNETIWPGFSKLPGVKVNFVKHQYNLLRKRFPATSFTGSPVLSDAGFDLLNKLLTYDPDKRITAEAALNHAWFHEVPLPKSKDFMPTFPAQHAQDRRTRRVLKSPDPLEEQRRKELQQRESGTGGLFG